MTKIPKHEIPLLGYSEIQISNLFENSDFGFGVCFGPAFRGIDIRIWNLSAANTALCKNLEEQKW